MKKQIVKILFTYLSVVLISFIGSNELKAQVVFDIHPSGNIQLCAGASITITADPLPPGYTYQWMMEDYGFNNCDFNIMAISGATDSWITVSSTSVYWCEAIDINGQSVALSMSPAWVASLSDSVKICYNSPLNFCKPDSVDLWVLNIWDAGIFGTPDIQWQLNGVDIPNANTFYYYAKTSGTYRCRLINSCGFKYTNSVVVTANPNPSALITANGPTTFCTGGSVVLNGPVNINYTYVWKRNGVNISGGTSSSFTASTSGTYTVRVTNTATGCSKVTSPGIVVTVNPNPSATITPAGPTTFCQGVSVVLNGPVNINYTYVWKKNGVNISGATLSSYTASSSGTYTVRVTNTATGCSKVTNPGIVVTKNPLPTATITPAGTITFCAGQSALLTANSGTGYTYKWKKNGSYINGATAMTYTVTTAGNYRVEVTNSYGCTKTSSADTVVVPCKEGENIFAENNFDVTVYPNPSSGDFVFEIKNTKEETISIEVFDMIGKPVINETFNNSKFEIRNPQLSPGIYSAVITVGEKKRALKIVKTE